MSLIDQLLRLPDNDNSGMLFGNDKQECCQLYDTYFEWMHSKSRPAGVARFYFNGVCGRTALFAQRRGDIEYYHCGGGVNVNIDEQSLPECSGCLAGMCEKLADRLREKKCQISMST